MNRDSDYLIVRLKRIAPVNFAESNLSILIGCKRQSPSFQTHLFIKTGRRVSNQLKYPASPYSYRRIGHRRIYTQRFITIIFANKFFTSCEITFLINSLSTVDRPLIIIYNDYIYDPPNIRYQSLTIWLKTV